jgi:hypothetical protein
VGSDRVSESDPRVIVRDREQGFVLPFPSEVHVDQLPAVIAEPAVDVAAAAAALPSLLEAVDDTYVPPEVEQRLIYRWLRDGPPAWRASIVAQAAPVETPVVVPLFRPDLPHGPHRRHDAGDGTARVIRYRE